MLPQELKAVGPDKEVFLYEGIAHPVRCDGIRHYRDKHFKSRLLPRAGVPMLEIRGGFPGNAHAAAAFEPAVKLRRRQTSTTAMADPTQHTATAPANAQQRYEVTRADLPLSCPLPAMALWNSHPRVYLAIETEGGESQCPYCGAHFVLID